jgi:hypothetical protein
MAISYPTSLDTFTNPTTTSLLTSPSHAQQHSDINDAVEALEAKVAVGNTVLGTYTSYTPSFVNVSIGNGTTLGAYCRVNNWVHYYGSFTLGSSSTVTGGITINLPINANADMSSVGQNYGLVSFYDLSATTIFAGVARYTSSASTLTASVQNAAGAYLQNQNANGSVPMTWTTGDIINFNLYYRAA